MTKLFAALVCVFIVTANVSESNTKSVEGKVICNGCAISIRDPILSFVNGIIYERHWQGVGVFISPKFALTVAQSLFIEQVVQMCRPPIMPKKFKQISPKYLKVLIQPTADYPTESLVQVLDYEYHYDYISKTFSNDIALLLVTKHPQFETIDPKSFPQLPKEAVAGETVQLYAFENGRKPTPFTIGKALQTLPADIVSKTYCSENFDGIFDEINHFCSEVEDGLTENSDIGSPLLKINEENKIIVGLCIIGEVHETNLSLYVNIVKYNVYIEQAKERLEKK